MTVAPTVATEDSRDTRRLVVVSADTHIGPRVAEDLRPYCPQRHLEAFDEFADELRRKHEAAGGQMGFGGMTRSADGKVLQAVAARIDAPTSEQLQVPLANLPDETERGHHSFRTFGFWF